MILIVVLNFFFVMLSYYTRIKERYDNFLNKTELIESQGSSEEERWCESPEVMGSIPILGIFKFVQNIKER